MISDGWVTYNLIDSLHVCPIRDIKAHEVSDDNECWCEPSLYYENDIPIYTHNSADGREKYETIN